MRDAPLIWKIVVCVVKGILIIVAFILGCAIAPEDKNRE